MPKKGAISKTRWLTATIINRPKLNQQTDDLTLIIPRSEIPHLIQRLASQLEGTIGNAEKRDPAFLRFHDVEIAER